MPLLQLTADVARRATFRTWLIAQRTHLTGPAKDAVVQTLNNPNIFDAIVTSYGAELQNADNVTATDADKEIFKSHLATLSTAVGDGPTPAPAPTPNPSPFVAAIEELIQFLVANGPAIIAFIQEIVSLFSGA